MKVATAPATRGLAWWLAAALAALVFAAFWPALSGEFQNIDDDRLFTLQRSWRGLSPAHLRWMASTAALSHYYPLTWLTFGVDYELYGFEPPAGANEAPGYHVTSVALHALAAVALFFAARRLLALAAPSALQRTRDVAAALGACLWAVHPLRVESVVWLSERSDVLSTLFLFLALHAWLVWAERQRGASDSRSRSVATIAASGAGAALVLAGLDLSRVGVVAIGSTASFGAGVMLLIAGVVIAARGANARWYALASALVLCSLLSKAWGIVLPAVLLVIDAWPLRRWSWKQAFALVAEKAPLAALALVFARLARFGQASAGGDTVASWSDHTLHERIAQAGYGLAYYPFKTLAPADLQPLYGLPGSLSLSEPRWFLPLAAVIAVSLLALALRRRWPALLAAWVVFAILVSPVLGFSQSGPQLVADRYSYLSCVSLSLLIGAGAAVAIARAPRIAAPLALAAVAALGVATWRQSSVWSTSEKLWERAVEIDPGSGSNLMSLGALRSHQANAERDPARQKALLEQALALHTRASELSTDPLILRNAAQVHTALVRADPTRAQEHRLAALEFARRALEQAQREHKVTPDYHFDYGTDLINLGRFDEGLPHLRKFVAERPERLLGWVNLGVGLVLSGNVDEGLACLKRACEIEPNDVRPWETLAGMCEQVNRRAGALAAWRRVLALDPRHAAARQRVAALGG